MVKKLAEKDLLEYKPPFRGTELKVLKRVGIKDLKLDFDALSEKLERAEGKLDEMEAYAYSSSCRQKYILKYFGEKDSLPCEKCDQCLRGLGVEEKEENFEDGLLSFRQKEYLS